VFLQREGEATNIPVGSSKSKALTFSASLCAQCNNVLTQPYDMAWGALSKYLQSNWSSIIRAGRFDLSKPFPTNRGAAAINVHLYFVKVFGCKLFADNIPIDLSDFSRSLIEARPHPQISLFVADGRIATGQLLAYDSEVHCLRNEHDKIDSALWVYLVHPVAIKVNYLNAAAPLSHPEGYPWHPTRQRKIVRLSPYMGDSEPIAGRARIV
jgi:hypothetical protein